jgi:hypothetical protein
MRQEETMTPVEITIIAVSDKLISVSIDYHTQNAAAVRRWVADRAVVDGLCDRFEALLRETAESPLTEEEKSSRPGEIAEKMASLGLAFYQEIMKDEGDELRSRMGRSGEDRYLIFKVDRSLGYVPFEVMHDGQAFLSHAAAVGRVIVTEDVEQPAPPAPGGPSRVLVIGDPSDDPTIREDVEREIAAVRDVFARHRDYRLRIASGRDVDRGFLLSNLPGTALFHFTGHGAVSEEPEKTGIRLWGDKVLGADALKGLRNPPAVAFLNMCTASPRTAWKGTLGLVESLLRRGVRACIASLWDVRSRPATELASRFYTYLLKGDTFGEALRRSRIDTARTFGIHDATWAAYVLYGDPRLALGDGPVVRARMGLASRVLALVAIVVFVLAFFLLPSAIQKERLGSRVGVPVGYLLVESHPADALIVVDGEVLTRTPGTIEMPAGRHHLVIEKQGFKRWEAWVEVKGAERTEIRADLVGIR